ncbi:hypothetical protein DQ393_03980 [Rhizobium tropici]|uniref:Uncharacterized protein n=1 Tax=Rhizobium tropici TaxID=398 RepID=A0A329YIS5_RHITR|nr:hypothetical protein DQ393_03980 [Rhizobium tropici]
MFRIRLEVSIARRGVPFLLAPGPRGGGMKGAYVTIYDIASIAGYFRRSKLGFDPKPDWIDKILKRNVNLRDCLQIFYL